MKCKYSKTIISLDKKSPLSLYKGELNPYNDLETFIYFANNNLDYLQNDLSRNLNLFKKYGNQDGYLLIKNLPKDKNLINTPIEHKDVFNKNTFISEFCLTLIGSFLGEVYGYKDESDGIIFNNLRPKLECENLQISESSQVLLELHTETAFHEFRPDFLLIYCLRHDREKVAKTGVASIRNALKSLDEKTIKLLFESKYSVAIDLSFGNKDGKDNILKTIPILSGTIDDPYMVYDSDLMEGLTTDAKKALEDLDLILRKTMTELTLEAGDLVIIDNKRTSHSRSKFKAYYDGYDRWLQRLLVKQDFDIVRKKLSLTSRSIEEVF